MYRMTIYSRAMPKRDGPRGDDRPALAGPATLILSSLADGPKHGYALTKDVEEFAGVHLAPGTLYEALARLESQGLIEALEPSDRRRPYQLTAAGAMALQAHLDAQRRVTDTGLRRLRANWGTS
jgi:DNA-binding PadR family transcriptional regulator